MKQVIVLLSIISFIFVSGCSQKTKYTRSELSKATGVCNSQFKNPSEQNRNNSDYTNCVAKNIGMSQENLLSAADKIDSQQASHNNARNQCGNYLGVSPNLTRGLNPEFDSCIRRVLGIPSLQELNAIASIASARRTPVYNQNVYVNSPYGNPQPIYADPFGSMLRGARGY